jgi:hypothetical protein
VNRSSFTPAAQQDANLIEIGIESKIVIAQDILYSNIPISQTVHSRPCVKPTVTLGVTGPFVSRENALSAFSHAGTAVSSVSSTRRDAIASSGACICTSSYC